MACWNLGGLPSTLQSNGYTCQPVTITIKAERERGSESTRNQSVDSSARESVADYPAPAAPVAESVEPVAWMIFWNGKPNSMTTFSTKLAANQYAAGCASDVMDVRPIYAAPQPSHADGIRKGLEMAAKSVRTALEELENLDEGSMVTQDGVQMLVECAEDAITALLDAQKEGV